MQSQPTNGLRKPKTKTAHNGREIRYGGIYFDLFAQTKTRHGQQETQCCGIYLDLFAQTETAQSETKMHCGEIYFGSATQQKQHKTKYTSRK